ncbi:threonine ammonia-lyase [Methanothrix soehngenii]|jgi:threonine dehydratase|uniref:threonine ammonia-lyase n=1 Tax=Methanothrix soehngenii TaxID=2223 RepID=UPI0023F4D434|nr:threonine ammonia-lyase [Methanothrix soehngenii]MCK9586870.1 threonine ammonia-lyase [Methanothrix soehngenii]MDD5257072.1 threonine ammonia-lyase [Methanothrix soehngenii]
MIEFSDVLQAANILKDRVIRTPLVYSPTFSRIAQAEVYLKLESLQMGGSFKVRGATYKLQSNLKKIQPGVIAASVGNHAQGVALAASAAGVPATIIMPVWASISKQEATRAYGAEVRLMGKSLVESIEIGRRMAQETNRIFIHPFDDEEVIAGQGTVGLEILEDLPDTDLIIVPVGGGGLIAGIALAAKAIRPEARVVGVQAASCPSARKALELGRPAEVQAEERGSIADAIMVTQVGEAPFPLLQKLVDEIVLVDEEQIASAVLKLLERKRILAEGAAAAPLAALLSGSLQVAEGSRVVLVVSGGNVDSLLLERIIAAGLFREGRLMHFSVCLVDSPGSLARLLGLLADQEANVVHIRHARNEGGVAINYTRVDLELETRGFEHIKEIERAMDGAGYRFMRR